MTGKTFLQLGDESGFVTNQEEKPTRNCPPPQRHGNIVMPSKKRNPLTSPIFKAGDKVRVKRGVEDVDYSDMPLGGWAGTVTRIDGADTFTVRWTEQTMMAIHPIFKQRCEIDGLDVEEYVLAGRCLLNLIPRE